LDTTGRIIPGGRVPVWGQTEKNSAWANVFRVTRW